MNPITLVQQNAGTRSATQMTRSVFELRARRPTQTRPGDLEAPGRCSPLPLHEVPVGRSPEADSWPLFGRLLLAARWLAATPARWRSRHRGRRELAGLSAHTLRDIGLTRGDIYREASKPFWRS